MPKGSSAPQVLLLATQADDRSHTMVTGCRTTASKKYPLVLYGVTSGCCRPLMSVALAMSTWSPGAGRRHA